MMPYYSKKAKSTVSNKVKKLLKEGKKQDQAVAIALDMDKRKKK
tara:strand:- start:3165 stop:3296 length:132 start_codon:yes stop_codon:yes gene_type:complete